MENSQELVKKLIDWIESTSDLVKAQLPDFAQQYLKAMLIQTWMNIIIISIVIITLIVLSFFCIHKQLTSEKTYDNFFVSFFSFFAPFFTLITLMGLIKEIHTLINIYVAPKPYILFHLKDIIK